jgi:DNA invertase Pin-like site-specific DNA recombinase
VDIGVYFEVPALEDKAVTIAIYVRVSSKTQDTRSRESDLCTWAKGQEEEVAWYRDTFTGTEMNCPGLDRLLDDVRVGKVTRVVCWRLDRMGRTSAFWPCSMT